MSFAMTAIHTCFSSGFLLNWLRGWGIGFCVGYPTARMFVPLARHAVHVVTDTDV
ncbi:MAG: DUF2798 domain-containing protein [Proteobacteria bacterium]|nr:DUF2798 domain-containing protein [Pseudomonadota bacterium]